MASPLRFKESVGMVVVGVADIAFAGGACVAAWQSGQRGAVPLFIPMLLLGIAIIVVRSDMAFTDAGISRRLLGRTYFIAWTEVIRIETDGATLLFVGHQKHLPICPTLWPKEMHAPALMCIREHLMGKGIPVDGGKWTSWRLPWNTRHTGSTGVGSSYQISSS
jgi:hypothetical protein